MQTRGEGRAIESRVARDVLDHRFWGSQMRKESWSLPCSPVHHVYVCLARKCVLSFLLCKKGITHSTKLTMDIQNLPRFSAEHVYVCPAEVLWSFRNLRRYCQAVNQRQSWSLSPHHNLARHHELFNQILTALSDTHRSSFFLIQSTARILKDLSFFQSSAGILKNLGVFPIHP